MRYAEALDWLYRRDRFGVKLGLETMQALLQRLENPETSFRALHATGTNGKGSVCAMLESTLRASGRRVGLYTSPHLVTFRERIRVAGDLIPEEDVTRGVERIRPHVDELDGRRMTATFFECVTALAFDYFRSQRIDLAVVEVGLGGRLDATNLVHPMLSIVTNVGMDHMDRLGPSVQAIATEKAGIIRPGVPVVTAARREALDVLARETTRRKTVLRVVRRPEKIQESLAGTRFSASFQGQPREFETRLLGEHQAENAAVALATLDIIRPEVAVETDAAMAGLRDAQWPGRLELVDREPVTLLDGAHNAPAMDALVQFLGRQFPDRNVAALVGILRDKQATKMLATLAPYVRRVVMTRAPNPRALSPQELEHSMPHEGPPTVAFDDPSEALRALFSGGTEPVKLITGSLFLVGEARARLLRLERDPPVSPSLIH